jgi:anti-sigma regulatory factor (Ser/Thr protein kinase)
MPTVMADRAWCVVVPHHPRGASTARHRLLDALRGRVHPERLTDAVTVLAELVGNAVRHAAPLPGNVVQVAWRLLDGGGVQIWVTDGGSSKSPIARIAGPDALDGRGLTIVQALAARWGVERDWRGQCVWAELV